MITTVDIETTYDSNFNPSPFIATNKIVSVGINKEYYFYPTHKDINEIVMGQT